MDSSSKKIRTYLGKFQFEFDAQYLIDQHILQYGEWEAHVLSYINNFVKPDMVVVDVGANAGYHTLLMADLVGAHGTVYAFELNPDTRNRLIRNLELNPQLLSRVNVCDQGVGAKEETLYLHCDDRPESIGNAGLVKEQSSCNSLLIKVVKLDDFIKSAISFMKIDVEGMELQVLEGSKLHIESGRPIIVYETLQTLPPEAHKPIEDFLKQYDYHILVPSLDGSCLVEIEYPLYPYNDCVAIFAMENKGS